jgi:hypothetical protein
MGSVKEKDRERFGFIRDSPSIRPLWVDPGQTILSESELNVRPYSQLFGPLNDSFCGTDIARYRPR